MLEAMGTGGRRRQPRMRLLAVGDGALHGAVELAHTARAAAAHPGADSTGCHFRGAFHLGTQAHEPRTRAFQEARAA